MNWNIIDAHCLIDHHRILTSFSAVIHFVLVLGAHPINTRNSSVRLTACRGLGLRGSSKLCMCKLHVRLNGATINAGLLPCLLSESRVPLWQTTCYASLAGSLSMHSIRLHVACPQALATPISRVNVNQLSG